MKKSVLTLGSIIIAATALSACTTMNNGQGMMPQSANVPAKSAPAPATLSVSNERADLREWKGSFVSIYAYLNKPEMQPYVQEAAKEAKPEMTIEAVKQRTAKRRGADFEGLIIGENNTLTIVPKLADLDAPKERPVEYTFVKSYLIKRPNKSDLILYGFEAKGNAQYKAVLLKKIYTEDNFTHFHLVYGNSVDELANQVVNQFNHPPLWFPTFTSRTSTLAGIAHELLE